ncbi:MAG: hypothetical protein ACSHWN_04945 [Methylophilaceae bacterium]
MKHAPNARRKFLAGLSALAAGSVFLGYKTLNSNAKENNQLEISSSNKPVPKAKARMGINFSGIAYWASELPFANLMRQSGEWVSQPADFGEWGKGPKLDLDENGWVKKLEKGCGATKILCAGDKVRYPSGTYTILYDGEGEIELLFSVGVVRKQDEGLMEADVDATKGMLAINIIATNPQNHMRNIRVIAPGLASSAAENPWHPDFLKRWQGVACIRVMDMMATNHSKQSQWQDRPKPNDVSYAVKGVPVELLVDLANRLQADIWFCMPHLVTDEYIKQFAVFVKNNLQPGLRAWVEYSNEVWNGAFDQYHYAEEQGTKLQLNRDRWQAAFLFNAKRSVEIFKIWESVFDDHSRIIRVIASQAANEWHADQLLKAPEVTEHVDVLAIAPYISLNIPLQADGSNLDAETVANWRLDKLFATIDTVALPQSKQWMQKNKKVADAHGVKLVAYEAGQHLVGVAGAENNDKLTELFLAANQDERMGKAYTEYLDTWQSIGGDLICLFNSTEKWSRHGSWGLLQDYNEAASNSPKFEAVMAWAKAQGQQVNYE